jgi:hypothetical protein
MGIHLCSVLYMYVLSSHHLYDIYLYSLSLFSYISFEIDIDFFSKLYNACVLQN